MWGERSGLFCAGLVLLCLEGWGGGVGDRAAGINCRALGLSEQELIVVGEVIEEGTEEAGIVVSCVDGEIDVVTGDEVIEVVVGVAILVAEEIDGRGCGSEEICRSEG